MGFYATDQCAAVLEPCQENLVPPSKNRVWNFFTASETCAGFFESQPVESHQEKWPTPTPTVSGVHYYGLRYYQPESGRWLSRDPMGERGADNLYGYVDNDAVNLVDPDGRGIWPFNRRKKQPEYEAVVQGADPTFPQQGIWMCQEELVGKSVIGPLHHRFVVFDGNAHGFEKRTRWPWGGEGGVRDEGAPGMKVRNDVSCYEMKCLKKDCARKIFDKAVSSGQGKRYWLGFRDCQSWANNVERSMYKQCEDCPCSEEDKARRNTWKHTGWREITLNDSPAPAPDPGPWPPPEDPSPGFPIFNF